MFNTYETTENIDNLWTWKYSIKCNSSQKTPNLLKKMCFLFYNFEKMLEIGKFSALDCGRHK